MADERFTKSSLERLYLEVLRRDFETVKGHGGLYVRVHPKRYLFTFLQLAGTQKAGFEAFGNAQLVDLDFLHQIGKISTPASSHLPSRDFCLAFPIPQTKEGQGLFIPKAFFPHALSHEKAVELCRSVFSQYIDQLDQVGYRSANFRQLMESVSARGGLLGRYADAAINLRVNGQTDDNPSGYGQNYRGGDIMS